VEPQEEVFEPPVDVIEFPGEIVDYPIEILEIFRNPQWIDELRRDADPLNVTILPWDLTIPPGSVWFDVGHPPMLTHALDGSGNIDGDLVLIRLFGAALAGGVAVDAHIPEPATGVLLTLTLLLCIRYFRRR
jgi:hypothetical protein